MVNLINKILIYIKIILLLIVFTVTLYILLLRMDYNELSVLSLLPMFIPLFLVLVGFVFSYFLNKGNDNIIFNISSVLVLIAIIVILYRTLFDSNIISQYTINLNYFDNYTFKIETILYLTFIANLMIIYDKKEKNNKIHS